MHAKGRDVHILKYPHKRACSPQFSHSCSHQIVCCSVDDLHSNSQKTSWADKDNICKAFNVAVGLSDGSVILLVVQWDTVQIQNVVSLNECVSALYCGAGYVLASSISEKCSLLYAQRSSDLKDELQWIHLEVSFPPLISSNRSRRTLPSNPSVITSFPTSSKACRVDAREQHDLLASYFDAGAALLISTPTLSVAEVQKEEPESELLLIGCTDGTLWWLQTPHRSTVLDLYNSDETSSEANKNETNTDVVTARLLHTCHTSIQRIVFTGLSLNSEKGNNLLADDSIKSICVVECDGKATLLGMENAFKKSTWTFQFPAYINVSTITYYKGIFLCVNNRTGMLCAITIDSAVPVVSKSNSSSACCAAQVSDHVLTPKTSPGIKSFSIISTSDTGDGEVEGDVLILHTQDTIIRLPLQSNDNLTQHTAMNVINTLQRACGGGFFRHPYTLAPIQVYASNTQLDTPIDSILIASIDGAAADTTAELAQLELLSSQLCEVGEENENILQQSLQADLEILQLTALLQELPGTLKAVCCDKSTTTNNVILCNPTRSIEVRYRFRTEPIPNCHTSTHNGSSDKCTYMDITIYAHSLQAMRALQGRTMTIRVHSTFSTTSLHCSADSYSVQIIMQPVFRSGSERAMDKDIDTSEYECTVTIPVNHLSQLSSHRWVMSLVVEAPHTIDAVCSDGAARCSEANSSLLCIVDHIIPLSEVLPHILSANNNVSALSVLQQMCENGNCTTNPSQYSLTLNTISSGPNDVTPTAKSITEKYQHAVDKYTHYTDHQYNVALRSGNLLQAAFLPSMGSGSAGFHFGSGNSGVCTSRSKARDGKQRQKQRLTLSTSVKGPRNESTNNAGGATSSTQRYPAKHSAPYATTPNSISNSSSNSNKMSGQLLSTATKYNVNSDATSNSTDNSTTFQSNSAVLLASIATEVHAQQLSSFTTSSSSHHLSDSILDFKESDAVLLSTDLQQVRMLIILYSYLSVYSNGWLYFESFCTDDGAGCPLGTTKRPCWVQWGRGQRGD